jgi:hypothetical protein
MAATPHGNGYLVSTYLYNNEQCLVVYATGSALGLHRSSAAIRGAGQVMVIPILSDPARITEELGWYSHRGGILNICGNAAHLPPNGDFQTWMSNVLRTLVGDPLWTQANPDRV